PDAAERDRGRVEVEGVVVPPRLGEGREHASQALLVDGSAAEQVEVDGRAVGLVDPDHEEQRALQDELVGIGRLHKPDEETLDREPGQELLEVLAGRPGDVEEPLVDRRGEARAGVAHAIASTTGRITRWTRQTSAARQSSSIEPPCCRNSFRASRATSSPTRLRNLKQSATVFAGPNTRTGTLSTTCSSTPNPIESGDIRTMRSGGY